jgi:hypothetical protein
METDSDVMFWLGMKDIYLILKDQGLLFMRYSDGEIELHPGHRQPSTLVYDHVILPKVPSCFRKS